jgi:hypothetical protein
MTNKTDKNSNATRSGAQSKIELLPTDTNPDVQNTPQMPAEDFAPVVFSYTRRQALADGVQVDVSKMAAEAGFRIPVFITDTVYSQYVRVPEGVEMQDEEGRLWDILWMLRCAIKTTDSQDDRLPFQLYVRNDNRESRLVILHSVCGALDIDDPAPSITIMMPDED